MAERMVVICDVCGGSVAETVTLKVGARTLLKDLCSKHLAELVHGTRRPKRGRKPGVRSAIPAAKSARRARAGRPSTRRTRTAKSAATGAAPASG